MMDFAWDTLIEKLNSIKTEKDHCSFIIKKVERTAWKTKIVFHADIMQDDHQVTRRFSIELLPS